MFSCSLLSFQKEFRDATHCCPPLSVTVASDGLMESQVRAFHCIGKSGPRDRADSSSTFLRGKRRIVGRQRCVFALKRGSSSNHAKASKLGCSFRNLADASSDGRIRNKLQYRHGQHACVHSGSLRVDRGKGFLIVPKPLNLRDLPRRSLAMPTLKIIVQVGHPSLGN